MSGLPEMVKARRAELELSLRQVAERSGGLVSFTTVMAVERGDRSSYTAETLDGLAKGLDLPIERVQRAAGEVPSDADGPFVLPRRASRLSRRERAHVLELVDLLLEAKRRR